MEDTRPELTYTLEKDGLMIDTRQSHYAISWDQIDAARARAGVAPPKGVRIAMTHTIHGKKYGLAVAIAEPSVMASEELCRKLPQIELDRQHAELVLNLLKELLKSHGAARAGVVEENHVQLV